MPKLLVIFAAVLFGTTGTAQALGPDASPLAVGASRIIFGAALLWLIAGPARRAATGGSWPRWTVAICGLAVAIYQLSFFVSVDRTGVAVGTVVALGSAPALAGLLARVLRGEALTGRWMACTALAVAGIVLLVAGGRSASVDPGGVALALAAGAGYAIYTVLAKDLLTAGHAPEDVMARVFATGALLLVPVLPLAGVGFLGSGSGWAMVLYLAAIPTALAYVCFARGLRKLSAGETATLTLAEPLTAAALGALILDERPGALAIAGGVLVLAGLVALAAPSRRPGAGISRAGDGSAPVGCREVV